MEKQKCPKRRLNFEPRNRRRDSCHYRRHRSERGEILQRQRIIIEAVAVPHPSQVDLSELYEGEEEDCFFCREDAEVAIRRTHPYHGRELIAECPGPCGERFALYHDLIESELAKPEPVRYSSRQKKHKLREKHNPVNAFMARIEAHNIRVAKYTLFHGQYELSVKVEFNKHFSISVKVRNYDKPVTDFNAFFWKTLCEHASIKTAKRCASVYMRLV